MLSKWSSVMTLGRNEATGDQRDDAQDKLESAGKKKRGNCRPSLARPLSARPQRSKGCFLDGVVADGTELRIRGGGGLKCAIRIGVYAGAFYLPESHLVRFWTEDVPKRLERSYFMEIEASAIVDPSDKLRMRHLLPEAYRAIEDRRQHLYRLFLKEAPGIATF